MIGLMVWHDETGQRAGTTPKYRRPSVPPYQLPRRKPGDVYRRPSSEPIDVRYSYSGDAQDRFVEISLSATDSDLRRLERAALYAFLAGTNDISTFEDEDLDELLDLRFRIEALLGEPRPSDPGAVIVRSIGIRDGSPEPLQHAYVYLMKMYDVTKLGVTSDVDRRTKEHRRNGWKNVRVWKVRDMQQARRIERSCLQTASSLGALLTDTQVRAIMPQGGYTEVTKLTPEHMERLVDSALK